MNKLEFIFMVMLYNDHFMYPCAIVNNLDDEMQPMAF